MKSGPWTCFHCDDSFTDEASARLHFGDSAADTPACQIKAGSEQGLLGALRETEKLLASAWRIIHDESAEGVRLYHDAVGRHGTQLRLAEEAGYERGLADGREYCRGEHAMPKEAS